MRTPVAGGGTQSLNMLAAGGILAHLRTKMTRYDVRHVGAPGLDIWKDLIRLDPTALIFQTPEWLHCLTRCGWKTRAGCTRPVTDGYSCCRSLSADIDRVTLPY